MSLFNDLTENRFHIEVGWEVCWQLGGIYTVLRSKAPMATKLWGDRYCLVGPYNAASAKSEFEELPREGLFGRVIELLEQRGITAYFGRWLVTGKPQVILIDYLKSMHRLGEAKFFLWKNHHIEAYDEREVNDVILFGYLVADFFQCMVEAITERDPDDVIESGTISSMGQLPILAHFHEWMAAVALPEIKRRSLPIATVFTTHATLLGRYLAAHDPNFYHYLHQIDPYGAASAWGILPRFSIERAAAWSATVFTTVSDVTGFEAEHFLGRRPEVLLPNGLNIQRFAATHEFQNLHLQNKKQIHEFVMGHFFPNYTFDLDKTLYIFLSGRYEYRNKGIDLFIESLARLNWRLKCARNGVTVVAFIITRAPNRGLNVDVLKSQVLFKELKNTIGNVSKEMEGRLLSCAAQGKIPHIDDLLNEYDQLRIRRMTQAWKQNRYPAIVTHDMQADSSDPILQQLRACQLFNNPDDPVKIVFHPEFLSSTSPLLGMDYEHFVRGCHLGVFPSFYEPWGYTPMECVAMGIPSVTTDLAGFGTYISTHIPDHIQRGIYLIERRFKGFDESANQLTESMFHAISMDRRERIALRNKVESTSSSLDWTELITYYNEAHKLAIQRVISNQ